MNRRKKTAIVQWVFTVLFSVSVLLGVLLLSRVGIQLDLSPGRVFTLGSQTKELITTLDEPLEIRYFVSGFLNAASPRTEQIFQLLRQYERLGGGTVTVERIVDGGLTPEQLEGLGIEVERAVPQAEGGAGPGHLYSGVEIRYLDRRIVIPALIDPGAVEYEVTRAIFSVTRDTPLRVLVVSGSRGERISEEYGAMLDALDRLYELEIVDHRDLESARPDVVLVLGSRDPHPDLADRVQDALERGTGAFLALDGLDVDIQSLTAREIHNESFSGFLRHLGVHVEPLLLLDSRANLFPPEFVSGQLLAYPPWVRTDQRNIDSGHPLGVNAGPVDFFWPSPMRLTEPGRGITEALIVTSTSSWLQGPPFILDPVNRASIERDREISTGIYAVVAWNEGGFHDDSRVVVSADSDFLSNLVLYTDSHANFDFLVRSIDWIAGESGLARLSPAPVPVLRMDRIEEPFARMFTGMLIEALNVWVLPGIMVIVGVVSVRRRRNRQSS
ncbi:MAG: hypothetical protein EA383_11965 [Spirochaetaceae bacterium]|nr:MAG: hypothetical protein EA383_11965 [Spirochaetaceae bacterium]